MAHSPNPHPSSLSRAASRVSFHHTATLDPSQDHDLYSSFSSDSSLSSDSADHSKISLTSSHRSLKLSHASHRSSLKSLRSTKSLRSSRSLKSLRSSSTAAPTYISPLSTYTPTPHTTLQGEEGELPVQVQSLLGRIETLVSVLNSELDGEHVDVGRNLPLAHDVADAIRQLGKIMASIRRSFSPSIESASSSAIHSAIANLYGVLSSQPPTPSSPSPSRLGQSPLPIELPSTPAGLLLHELKVRKGQIDPHNLVFVDPSDPLQSLTPSPPPLLSACRDLFLS